MITSTKAKKWIKNAIFGLLLIAPWVNGYSTDHQRSFQKDTLQIIHTREEGLLKERLKEVILEAKESILLFTFTFSDREFINLLNKKAKEGVDTKIVIDREHKGPLLTTGSDQLQILTRDSGEGRLHHKLLVVDNRFVWIGSANFTSQAFSFQENLMMGIDSKELAQFITQESEVFEKGLRRTQIEPLIFSSKDQTLEYYLLPHCDSRFNSLEKTINTRGKKELIQKISGAKEHIRICMMLWTEPELADAIIKAHHRGVFVEVLLQDIKGDIASRLKHEGISVNKNSSLHFMHNKWMLVDNRYFIHGSANWSRSSFSRNDESFIILNDLDQEQIDYLNEYWTQLTRNNTN